MSNDYYVEFGSNATLWAAGLKRELEPARNAVQEVIDLMNTMQGKVGPVTQQTREELARRFGASPGAAPGAGGRGGGVVTDELDSLRTSVALLADESKAAGELLGRSVLRLDTVVTKIGEVPGKLTSTFKSLSSSIARIVEQAEGRGRSYNPEKPNVYSRGQGPLSVQHGSSEGEVYRMVREAAKRGIGFGPPIPQGAFAPQVGISRIGTATLERANFDRVILAIRAQTRVLSADIKGIGHLPGGGTPPPSPGAGGGGGSGRPSGSSPATPAGAKAAGTTAAAAPTAPLEVLRAKLAARDAQIDAVMAAVGTTADAGTKKLLADLKASRDQDAADFRKLEREATGVTRGQQSDRASKEFQAAQAAIPTITDEEKGRRLRAQALLESPGAPDFLEKAQRVRGSRARGDYLEPDLREMAKIFESVGVPVGATSKTTKQELANMLVAARQSYKQLYPDQPPEQLRTDGLKVTRTTKVDDDLKKVLGEVNGTLVARREADLAAIRADRSTGGAAQQQALREERLNAGTILVPPGMVKGRRGFGAAITESGVPGLIDAAAVKAAEERLARDPLRERPRALANPGFNPYDPAHDRGIEAGNTDTERAAAQAYRSRLRDLRAAFTELDKVGGEFLDSVNLLKVLDDRLARATARLKNATTPKNADKAQREIDQIRTQQDQTLAHLAQLGKGGLDKVFRSPEYKAGYAAREGNVDEATGLTARQQYLERVSRFGQTLSDARLLRQATAETVLGLGTAPGTRSLMRKIPGLAITRSGEYKSDDYITPTLSRKDQQALTSAANKLGSLQRQVIPNRSSVPNDAEREMELKLERAANHFANVLERLFNRQSVPIQALTGQDPRTVEAQIDEERRRTTRNQREQVRVTPPKETPDAKAARLAREQGQIQEQYNQAAARALAAEKALAAAEEAAAAEFEKLTPLQKQEYAAKQRAVQVAQDNVDKAQKAFNIANRGKEVLQEADAPGYIGPRLAPVNGPDAKKAQVALHAAEADLLRARAAAGLVGSTTEATPQVPKEITAEQKKELAAARRAANLAGKKADALAEQVAVLTHFSTDASGEPRRDNKRVDTRQAGRTGGLFDTHGLLGTNVPLDPNGYEMSLGYSQQSASQARATVRRQFFAAQAEAERKQARVQELERAGGFAPGTSRAAQPPDIKTTTGGIGNFTRLQHEAEDAQRALGLVTARLQEVGGTAEKAGKAAENSAKRRQKAVEDERKTLQTAVQVERDKQAAVRAEGKYTRGDKRAAFQRGGIDDPEYQAIAERQRQLRRIEVDKQFAERQLKAYNKANPPVAAASGGGGRGGGTKPPTGGAPPTPPGGGGENDRNILARILAALNQIHATLKGGVRVTETAAGKTVSAADATVQAAQRAAKRAAGPDAGLLAAIEAENTKQRELRLQRKQELTSDATASQAARASKRAAQGDAALRDQARAEQDLAAAVAKVTPATRQEIEVLRQLTAAAANASSEQERLAAAERIAAQQTKIAASVDRDLRGQGVGSAGRRDASRVVLNEAGPQLGGGELDKVLKSARTVNARSIGLGIGQQMGEGAQSGFQQVFGGGNSFWGRVLHTTGTFVVRNFAAGFVFGLTNYFQQVLDQAIQAESTFVRVRSALEATGKDLGNIRGDLQNISTDYGVQLNDVYQAAAGLTGLFDNSQDLAAGTRIVAQLQAISGGALNATEATGVLASTVAAFQRQAGDRGPADKFLPTNTIEAVSHVADVLTSIQNTLGVNIETSAEGVSRMAGLAKEMSLSFEETAVFTAQIAKQTNQTGASAGEQFSRIIGAIQTGRGRNAVLGAFDPNNSPNVSPQAIEQVRKGISKSDYGSVFRGLIAGWGSLSKAQQQNLAVALAGQRQQAAFQALMNNGSKTLYTLARAEASQGEAADRMDALMQTLNKRLARFSTEVQTLASNLVRAGLLDFLGTLLVITTKLLGAVNGLLTAFNKIADANPAIDTLRTAIAFLIGGALAFKAFNAGLNGFRGAVGQFRRATAAPVEEGAPPPRPPRTPYSSRTDQGGYRSPIFGRVGYGAQGAAERLRETEQARLAAAAQAREIYREQQRYSSSSPAQQAIIRGQYVAAGHDEAAIRSRTAAPDGRLVQEASSHERVARAAGRAAAATEKAAGGLDKLARSGAVADGVMIALGFALTAFMESQARHAEQSKNWRKGVEDLTASQKKNADGTTAQKRFYGATNEAFTNSYNDLEHAGKFSQGIAAIGAVLSHPKVLSDLLPGNAGITHLGSDYNAALGAEVGIDTSKNESYGLTAAQNLLKSATKDIGGVKPTADAVKQLTDEYAKKIADEATAIANDKSTSDGQKEAAIANLEYVKTQIEDQLANLKAIAYGAKNAVALTASDVEGIQTLVSVRQSLGAGVTANGLDLTGLLAELQSDTGAANIDGSYTKKLLDRISNPETDSIDQLLASRNLMKQGIISLRAQWEAKSKIDPNGDEAQQLKTQLLSLLQQYGQANDQIFAAINQNADLIATQLFADDKPRQAMQTYARAMARADHEFDRESRLARQAIRQVRRNYTSIFYRAAKLDAELGGTGEFRIPKQDPAPKDQGKAARERKAKYDAQQTELFQKVVDHAISLATKDIDAQIARTADAATRAGLEYLKAQIANKIITTVNAGNSPGYGITADQAERYGNQTIDPQELATSQNNVSQAQLAATQSAQDAANTARQNAAALKQAQLGVAQAYADARGDAVASAKIQAAIARASIAAARADLAAATTADQTSQARIAILNAQAQLIAASAAIHAAQADLVQSQYQVTIALADAAGNTVKSARISLAAARAAVKAALAKSGGEATAEVNQARVTAIQAEASLRDAKLQDSLDTIDFNLQMGRITQQSAIQALQQILRTSELTKAQRRQLLLQIKGMKDELSNSQWNFGDIKLPTPYQLRRYVQQLAGAQLNGQLNQTVGNASGGGYRPPGDDRPGPDNQRTVVHETKNYFRIDGADIGLVRKVIREVVGGSDSINTRTTGARRGGY